MSAMSAHSQTMHSENIQESVKSAQFLMHSYVSVGSAMLRMKFQLLVKVLLEPGHHCEHTDVEVPGI